MANGNHTVYLQLLKNRIRKNISLGLKCRKEHFENEQFNKSHKTHKSDNQLLTNFKSRANQIIRDFQLDNLSYSLEDFEKKFRGKDTISNEANVIDFFNEIIDEMTRKGAISNAKAYESTRNSIVKFAGNKIKFKDITSTFLEKYEVFLKENGNENGGVSFKMRGLKALFNKARSRKIIPKEPYPFENYKVSKLKSSISKRALTVEDFKKIRDLDLSKYPHLINAYFYFMFSIYTRGMNFKDMMELKWSDIQENRITYTRSKTKGNFNIEILEPTQNILDFYKSQNRTTHFVFPILLHQDLTPKQIYSRKQNALKIYNSRLKEIAKIALVETCLSSYVARHTFATILKIKGASISKISEMMGHADVSVTMAYLKEFSNEDLDIENRRFLDL